MTTTSNSNTDNAPKTPTPVPQPAKTPETSHTPIAPTASVPETDPSTSPSAPNTIFDHGQKWLIVTIVSFAATFSGFGSNTYFPALPSIQHDLAVSADLVNLSVTSYLLVQGLAPSLWGPLSDARGRRLGYLCTLLVFLAACLGLARTPHGRPGYAVLVALRCLQSAGSSSTPVIGAAVVGDITTRAERAGFMGVFQAGLLAPVAIGPIIGGAVVGAGSSSGGDWRVIFWLLAAYAAFFLVILLLLLPETLRSLVANGSVLPPRGGLRGFMTRFPLSIYQRTSKVPYKDAPPPEVTKAAAVFDVLGPIRILGSKSVAPVAVYYAVYYAVWQMSITVMSSLFQERYDMSTMHIGLTFIANGVGAIIGTLLTGKILNADYRRAMTNYVANANSDSSTTDHHGHNDDDDEDDDNKVPIEKVRLRLIPLFSLLQCVSILVFGWTIQYSRRIHVAVPIIATFFVGLAAVATQSAISTYLVDVFPKRSAAAVASLNFARCLLGAAGTAIAMPMIHGMDVGWTFTVCVAVQMLALVGPFIQYRYAGQWRREAARQKAAMTAAE